MLIDEYISQVSYLKEIEYYNFGVNMLLHNQPFQTHMLYTLTNDRDKYTQLSDSSWFSWP